MEHIVAGFGEGEEADMRRTVKTQKRCGQHSLLRDPIFFTAMTQSSSETLRLLPAADTHTHTNTHTQPFSQSIRCVTKHAIVDVTEDEPH